MGAGFEGGEIGHIEAEFDEGGPTDGGLDCIGGEMHAERLRQPGAGEDFNHLAARQLVADQRGEAPERIGDAALLDGLEDILNLVDLAERFEHAERHADLAAEVGHADGREQPVDQAEQEGAGGDVGVEVELGVVAGVPGGFGAGREQRAALDAAAVGERAEEIERAAPLHIARRRGANLNPDAAHVLDAQQRSVVGRLRAAVQHQREIAGCEDDRLVVGPAADRRGLPQQETE